MGYGTTGSGKPAKVTGKSAIPMPKKSGKPKRKRKPKGAAK